MCTISVITVVKDALHDFEITAQSVGFQSLSRDKFEWIIKDGNSIDGTAKAIKEFKQKSNINVKSIFSRDNGIYDAMNIAMEKTAGDYMIFLNAGDEFASENILEKVSEIIDRGDNHTFIYGDVIDVLTDGKEIIKRARGISYISHSLPTSHQSIFYNRAAVGSIRYSTCYKIAGDYDFTARIYKTKYNSFHILGYPVCRFKLGGASTSLRVCLLVEAYRVQKQVLGIPLLTRMGGFVFRWFAMLCLDLMPGVYSRIRSFIESCNRSRNC